MRFQCITLVVSAIALTACTQQISTSDDLAAAYIETILKNNASEMAKISLQNQYGPMTWNNAVQMVDVLRKNPASGTITYTKQKPCWKAKDAPVSFCDYSINTSKGHAWSLTVKISDPQMKVDSAAVGR